MVLCLVVVYTRYWSIEICSQVGAKVEICSFVVIWEFNNWCGYLTPMMGHFNHVFLGINVVLANFVRMLCHTWEKK